MHRILYEQKFFFEDPLSNHNAYAWLTSLNDYIKRKASHKPKWLCSRKSNSLRLLSLVFWSLFYWSWTTIDSYMLKFCFTTNFLHWHNYWVDLFDCFDHDQEQHTWRYWIHGARQREKKRSKSGWKVYPPGREKLVEFCKVARIAKYDLTKLCRIDLSEWLKTCVRTNVQGNYMMWQTDRKCPNRVNANSGQQRCLKFQKLEKK